MRILHWNCVGGFGDDKPTERRRRCGFRSFKERQHRQQGECDHGCGKSQSESGGDVGDCPSLSRAAASGVKIGSMKMFPSGNTSHCPCCLTSVPTNRFCDRVMISITRPRYITFPSR